MSDRVSAETIAQALGQHKRSVMRRAQKEEWLFVGAEGNGGKKHLYPVLTLPPDIRPKVLALLSARDAALATALSQATAAARRVKFEATIDSRAQEAAQERAQARFAGLPEEKRTRAETRAALVELAHRYWRSSGMAKRRAIELFCFEYNAGRIQLPAWIRAAKPSVSAGSIQNWAAALEGEGMVRLVGQQGLHRIGTGVIDTVPGMRDFIHAMLLEYPHLSAKHLMRGLRARFVEQDLPSYRTVQRYLADWKIKNKQLLMNVANPDAWRSKFKAAGGDASARIGRLNQRWETDSTKGDLLLSDNHRHVIVGVIDVYSRRLKLHVSRTSSAAAVASALRRALLDWGVPEQLGTDNGADYVSRHVKDLVWGLQIDHDVAAPFTPEHKPFIERAFGTFCRDLVELLPGYVGHSVAERQDIRGRQSFAQRLMKGGGAPVELRLTPEALQELCDKWTDEIYAMDGHGGLDGRTPFAVAAAWNEPIRRIQNERALDVLLLPAPDNDGLRTVTKKGLKLDRAWFEAAELGGLEGQQVRLLLDEADIGEVYVFNLEGDFIAKAVCPERLGISRRELVAKRAAHQRRVLAESKAALKAAQKASNVHTIVRDIMDERSAAAAKVTAFPQRAEPHVTAALESAADALRADDARRAAPIVAPDVAERRAVMQVRLEAELAAPASNVVPLDAAKERFRRAIDLERALAAGIAVEAAQQQWLSHYQRQSEYRARKQMLEDYGETFLTA